jgi:hypothetical protein
MFRCARGLVSAGLVCGVLATATAGRAYSPSNHARLTARAVALYERCGQLAGAAARAVPLPIAILQHYNTRQDDLLSKSGLWHFPETAPDEGCPGPFPLCQLVILRSYEPWTEDIWRRVIQTLPAAQLYPALGAALHYVQDLAVPAHAVPVFHPRGWLDLHDAFDEYTSWDNPHSRPGVHELASECARLDAIARSGALRAILEQLRSETRASLSQSLSLSRGGSEVTLSFARLWQARGAGFGVYGCDDDFGEAELRCGDTSYAVAAGTYERFAGQRARSAILYSAATIALFEQKLAPCRGASCTPTEDEEAWLPTRCRIDALSRAAETRYTHAR